MALIAGYVADRPYTDDDVRRRTCVVSILPGDRGVDYEHAFVPTRFGHLVTKYRRAHPSQPRVTRDVEGNVLLTLGFLVPASDTRALMAAAAKSSGRALEGCEGEFVAIFAEAVTGTVHVVNDRFSSRPFYTFRGEDGLYFSSNPTFLLAFARKRYHADVVGWMQVSTVSHTVGTRTTIEGVARLRPATHLTITPEQQLEHQYWRLEHQPNPGLSPATHSNDVFAAFRAGAEQRSRVVDRGVLALSGGLDSRLVVGALPRNGNYSAFTFVDKRDADSTPQTRAAAAVCQTLGVRHRIEPIQARLAKPREVIALTGGMRPYHHMAIAMAYVHELQREGGHFLLGGGPGDVLAGSYVPSPLYVDPSRVNECMEDAYRRRLVRSREWNLIYRDEVIRSNRRVVEEDLARSFADSPGPTAAHRITAWAMTCRQPAFTFTSVFHTHPDVSEVVCHLDYRYADLMLQLPAAWLYRKTFYAYMIYSCLPELRHVPYADIGAVLSGRPPDPFVKYETRAHRTLKSIYSLGRRAAARVVRSILPRPGTPSLVFGDAALLDEVRECLHSISRLSDIVDLRRCDELLSRARAGMCPSEEALGSLVSLCFSFRALQDQ
jgi:Asparagine synthase/Glutamine amidotransferase domain